LGELQIKNQVVTTVAQVMGVYYNIIQQQEQLRATEDQMQLSADRLQLAQYKFDVGTGTKSDVLQAQVDYNAQRSLQLLQQSNIVKLKEQSNNLLQLPLNNDFVLVDTAINVNTALTLDSIQN